MVQSIEYLQYCSRLRGIFLGRACSTVSLTFFVFLSENLDSLTYRFSNDVMALQPSMQMTSSKPTAVCMYMYVHHPVYVLKKLIKAW